MGYKLLDHTADIAIQATGADLAEAMAHAARGLSEVVLGREPPRTADTEMAFRLEAPDEPSIIVAFLAELLWLLESDGMLWVGGGVKISPGVDGLVLDVAGNAVRYDHDLHGVGVEVKAVTYHGLHVERVQGGIRIQVIVDI